MALQQNGEDALDDDTGRVLQSAIQPCVRHSCKLAADIGLDTFRFHLGYDFQGSRNIRRADVGVDEAGKGVYTGSKAFFP